MPLRGMSCHRLGGDCRGALLSSTTMYRIRADFCISIDTARSHSSLIGNDVHHGEKVGWISLHSNTLLRCI